MTIFIVSNTIQVPALKTIIEFELKKTEINVGKLKTFDNYDTII